MDRLVFLVVLAVTSGTIAASGPMEQMLDVMSDFATGHPFDRTYLTELTSCWAKIDPNLLGSQNRMWQGFLNYSAMGGSPDGTDPWYPDRGCRRYGPHQGWFESNYSIIGGSLNMSVCEPCNFNSNLAFYRSSTRICAAQWNMSPEMLTAVVRGTALEAAGSAFMHGSETNLGAIFDTRGEIIVPILAHQMAIEKLPEHFRHNSILRDFSDTPQLTGVDLMDLLSKTFLTLPADQWAPILEKLPSDVSKPIGAIVGSIFTLVFPPKLVDALIGLIEAVLHNVIDPTAIVFLKEQYIPLFRNATAHIRLGPLKKLQIARTGIGGFIKFMYSTIWQEQVFDARKFTFLTKPWVNKLGADMMPAINGLADLLTGFKDTDEVVKTCGSSVYPGAGWCRDTIPHAKWHEEAANAYFDLVSLGDYLGSLYEQAARDGVVPEPAGDETQAAMFTELVDEITLWTERQAAGMTVAELEGKLWMWRACVSFLAAALAVCVALGVWLVLKVRRLEHQVESGVGCDARRKLLSSDTGSQMGLGQV